eukprot:scaffold33137_cov40-Cyclotella_meneghiniana.AAC.1
MGSSPRLPRTTGIEGVQQRTVPLLPTIADRGYCPNAVGCLSSGGRRMIIHRAAEVFAKGSYR